MDNEGISQRYEGGVSLKNCPFCAEPIQDAARKCRYCGEFLDAPAAAGPQEGQGVAHQEQAPCRFCGGSIEPGSAKCRHCGESLKVGGAVEATQMRTPTVPTQNPVVANQYGCVGGCGGLFATIAMVHGDLALFAAVAAMFIGYFVGHGNAPKTDCLGKCPYCEGGVRARANAPGFNCPHCAKRILIRDAQFVQA